MYHWEGRKRRLKIKLKKMKLRIPKLMIKKGKSIELIENLVKKIDGTISDNNDKGFIEVSGGLKEIKKAIKIVEKYKKVE